jgi:hypothetical protein
VNLDTYVRAQMARFAIEEGARHGGVNNMLAVVHVLRNRVFAGWGDWLEVLETAPEKRAIIYPPLAVPARLSHMRSGNVRSLLNRIDEVYSRADLTDLSGGALFYFEPGFEMAKWFLSEVIERPEDHPRTAHIGPVWFYK